MMVEQSKSKSIQPMSRVPAEPCTIINAHTLTSCFETPHSFQVGSLDSSSLISPATPTSKPKPTRRSGTPQKKKAPSPGSAGATPGSGAKSAAAKARDEARKKMLEEKKRNMLKMKKEQAAKAAASGDGGGAIFVEF